MSTPGNAPLIILGFDTGDPEFIQRWAQEGHLPTIASIMERGCWGRTGGPELVSEHGAWMSLFSGLSRGQHGYYYYRQLVPGTYDLKETAGPDTDAPPFWTHLRGRHKHVATIDIPDTNPIPGLPGLQLAHWATHNNWNADYFSPVSEPPELLQEVRQRFGAGLSTEEIHESTFETDRQIYSQLLNRIEKKGRLCRDLLTREPFDLIVVVFGESHVANHQFWEHHPDHVAPGTLENELTHAIRDVYRAIDRELGQLLEQLPSEANVVIVSSVGMVDDYPVTGLTEAFLRQLGYQAAPPGGGFSLNPMALARRVIPEKWRVAISQRLLSREAREHLLAEQFRSGTDWSRTTAFSIPAPYTSFIRVNLRGREPEGTVAPGADYDTLLDQIETDLRQLVDPATDELAVTQVERTRQRFGENAHEALPDLFVEWKPGRFMRRVVHPDVELTQDKPEFFRRSDHSAHGFIAAAGPSFKQHGPVGNVDVLDLTPTFLSLLGSPVSPRMKGRPLANVLHAGVRTD